MANVRLLERLVAKGEPRLPLLYLGEIGRRRDLVSALPQVKCRGGIRRRRDLSALPHGGRGSHLCGLGLARKEPRLGMMPACATLSGSNSGGHLSCGRSIHPGRKGGMLGGLCPDPTLMHGRASDC